MLSDANRFLRRYLRRLKSSQQPPVDHVISVNDLLYSAETGGVHIPFLPQQSREISSVEEGLEFNAASLLERVVSGALGCRHKAVRLFGIGTFRG